MKYFTIILSTLFFAHCSTQYKLIEEQHPYGLHGQLVAQKGKGGQLSEILLDAAKLMQQAKGCQMYMVGTDISDDNIVIITEIWDSKKDHDESLKLPGVQELITKAIPLLSAPSQQGQQFKILGGLSR